MGFDLDRPDVDPLAPWDEDSIPVAPGLLAQVPAAEADHAVHVHAERQRDE
jgi:hypothetical protein